MTELEIEELKKRYETLRGGFDRVTQVIDQIAQYCQKLQLTKDPYPVDVTKMKVGEDISRIIGQLSKEPKDLPAKPASLEAYYPVKTKSQDHGIDW